MSTALVYGIAVAGDALATELSRRGWALVVADDRPTDDKVRAAERLGATFVGAPTPSQLGGLVASVDVVCPAPGVPETHPVVVAALAAGRAVRSEIDLAYEWEQERPGGARPMLAITGTDGKTTTTMLTAHLLAVAGHRPAAVGNTEVPLVAALHDDVDVFAVECSSFRLRWAESFRAEAAAWLNLAPDHQNWHVSMEAYERAKARLWEHRRVDDVAIGFVDDPVVMRHLSAAGGRTCTFGASGADYRREGDHLVGPQGRLARVDRLPRRLPHDVTNSLAAVALVLESGLVPVDAIEEGLATFRHPPHRIEPLGTFGGVQWFNDSKATTPHAALAALRGFERVVLLAGGRNKGLDLASLATEHARVKAVVGLGESGPEVVEGFAGRCPTSLATSMADAVEQARCLAAPGDVVLLSPACASFDWYPDGGYPARGDDFRRCVRELVAGVGT